VTQLAWGWLVPFAAGALVLAGGWWATWFLCDDAFIAFRYVGNAHDGLGLVWNQAPFAPVEGYSSFLWVVVLWGVWAVTGVPPPQSSNPLALLCGLLTLLLVARRLAVVLLPERAQRWRGWLSTVVLLGIAGNHTFVTWTSSGLETAMFGLWAVGWTLAATDARGRWTSRDLADLSTFAALAQLTRPDGALLVLATFAIALHRVVVGRELSFGGALRGLVPLLVPAVHLGWRRCYYGEWLPNTYYAKVTAAWPESGWRYLYCFLLEHGLWLWLLLAAGCAIAAVRHGGVLRALLVERFPATAAVGTWCAFVGYYTLVVGGDHFAWRPFAHLVPLLFVSALVMAGSLHWGPRLLLGGLVLFAVAANSFGWWFDHALRGREKDGFLRASTALPSPLGGLFHEWDRCRAWLRLRYVALPRGLHAETCAGQLRLLPERRAGQVQGLPDGHRAVYRTVAAGVVSWSLADVAILDGAGLNDWIVARHPTTQPGPTFDPNALRPLFPTFDRDGNQRLDSAEIAAAAIAMDLGERTGVLVSPAAWGELLLAICDRDRDGLDENEFLAATLELGNQRHMAHERTPPAGYFEALRPNVVFDGQRFVAVPGVAPLTDAQIVAVEADYRARLGRK